MYTTALRGFHRSVIVLILFPLLFTQVASAQVGAALLAMTGNDLLKRADHLISKKLAEADSIGRGIVNQAVTGLAVTADSIRLNMGAVLEKSLRDMNVKQRDVFLELNRLTNTVNALSTQAYDLEQVAAIDLSTTLGNTILASKPTYISSIRGSLSEPGSPHTH